MDQGMDSTIFFSPAGKKILVPAFLTVFNNSYAAGPSRHVSPIRANVSEYASRKAQYSFFKASLNREPSSS